MIYAQIPSGEIMVRVYSCVCVRAEVRMRVTVEGSCSIHAIVFCMHVCMRICVHESVSMCVCVCVCVCVRAVLTFYVCRWETNIRNGACGIEFDRKDIQVYIECMHSGTCMHTRNLPCILTYNTCFDTHLQY